MAVEGEFQQSMIGEKFNKNVRCCIGCVTIELCHNLEQHVPQSIPAAPRLPPRRLPRRERRSPHVKVRPGQSSTLDTQFGPRTVSVTEFAAAVESGSSLSRSQLDRLFRATGG